MNYTSLGVSKPSPIDARDFKLKGRTQREKAQSLADQIEQAVKETQSVVIRTLPDRLILSVKQYRFMSGLPELLGQEIGGQEFFLYRTKYNVMEIEVK